MCLHLLHIPELWKFGESLNTCSFQRSELLGGIFLLKRIPEGNHKDI